MILPAAPSLPTSHPPPLAPLHRPWPLVMPMPATIAATPAWVACRRVRPPPLLASLLSSTVNIPRARAPIAPRPLDSRRHCLTDLHRPRRHHPSSVADQARRICGCNQRPLRPRHINTATTTPPSPVSSPLDQPPILECPHSRPRILTCPSHRRLRPQQPPPLA